MLVFDYFLYMPLVFYISLTSTSKFAMHTEKTQRKVLIKKKYFLTDRKKKEALIKRGSPTISNNLLESYIAAKHKHAKFIYLNLKKS